MTDDLKYCCLEDGVICNDCGECLRCDLDPAKQCDNCGKCIDSDADYRGCMIEDIILDEDALAEAIAVAMDEADAADAENAADTPSAQADYAYDPASGAKKYWH